MYDEDIRDDELIDDDPTEIVDDPIEEVEKPVNRQRVRNAKIADADKQKVKGARIQTDVDMVFVIDRSTAGVNATIP